MSHSPHDILRDSAVAVHASSARPAWLFTSDGSRLVFANATGAAMLGVANDQDVEGFKVPNDLAARIARSAATLRADGHPRLERLRGLGAAFGQPLTCICLRIERPSGPAMLVAATETAGPQLTLLERARYLIKSKGAAAAFGPDGELLYATVEASSQIRKIRSLADLDEGIETLRVGEGNDAILLAFFPANSQLIKSVSFGAPARAESDLLDLSPIAEAITAMSKVPPQRNGHEGPPRDASQAAAAIGTFGEASKRRLPLRFTWETDAENRFVIDSEEFTALAGARTANLLGRFWGEISAKLALDPEGLIAHALVSRDTWSGIDVRWPTVDGHIAVTLSGIPVFDQSRTFRGYRGLGVWQGAAPAVEPVQPEAPKAIRQSISDPAFVADAHDEAENASEIAIQIQDDIKDDIQHDISARVANGEPVQAADRATSRTQDTLLQTENVVLFPTAHADPKTGGLSATERSAFRDLGSRLTSRLKGADELARGLAEKTSADDDPPYVPPVALATPQSQFRAHAHALQGIAADSEEVVEELAAQRTVLDKIPLGVLIYHGSSLLYANPAFLRIAGHSSLRAFDEAGGLDSMPVEFDGASDETGARRVRIAASDKTPALDGRLVATPVAGESAMMLMLQPAPQSVAHAPDAGDLGALLDIAADGVVTIDRDAIIRNANTRAEKLFGYDAGALSGRPFGDLFVPESERIAKTRFDRFARSDAIADDESREVVGRRQHGGSISLQMTLGRENSAGSRFHVLFRDVTRWTEAEKELTIARQHAEKASAAKSEFLAKISHEMRTPLNAIIGFSEVMMEERFGPVGNERYRDYLKDINTSGTHAVSLLNDLLDLSKIEAGKMELSFERVDLNDVTQQSVAIMQAQASRARVIVRTALSVNIPSIVADTRSVRQIALNILSNSIKFTGAGGQVIVSTACNDRSEVILRVRDTGIGMSEKDIETALQPFRQLATTPRSDVNGTGLGLPLTKALVEANRARFSIKSAVNAGTLVEIVFPAIRSMPE